MNYRFDHRSKEEFRKDIHARTMEERALFLMWLDLVEKETGTRPKYKDTGCGKSGEFLEEGEVSTSPDFEVEGYGTVEVKFSKPLLKENFHLKVSQVKQYAKNNTTVLMVNGSNNDIPSFTMIKPESLQKIMDTCEQVPWGGFGGKMSYRILVGTFIWRNLK